jgi:hypothetical protein
MTKSLNKIKKSEFNNFIRSYIYGNIFCLSVNYLENIIYIITSLTG